MFCPKCREKIEEGSSFCQTCGTVIEQKVTVESMTEKGLMSRIEQNVYFRIARGFAWFILLLVTISLVIYIVKLAPTALELFGGETRVSQDEIKRAIAAEKERRPFMLEETSIEKMDPELMSRLDKEIYELILLLPADIQAQWGVERLREYIKNSISFVRDTENKITVINEARGVLQPFALAERMEAMGKFFKIKDEKVMSVKNKKEAAKVKLLNNFIYILSAIIFITLLSMILVLLAVERNTRKA
jgi:hypothetical protein